MDISEKLKQCRKEKSLTQAQVAEKLHVSRKTISGWENGRSYPDVNSFVQLSNLYRISLDSLLRDDRVLNYYKKQNKKNIQIHKIAKISYIFNFFLWVISYVEFFRIGGLHLLIIPALLTLNIIIFISHYENWHKLKKPSYFIKVIITFVLIFVIHIVLNVFAESFMYELHTTSINYITDLMLGRLILITLIDSSLVIVIFCRDVLNISKKTHFKYISKIL
ncbi:helix-turn-helix domain-containing protein [Pediococcus ethanolidurans]|uniref:helix-turn-helix domain-containing protein n=1 Tax=Pediococcus ethanolidurans TaxID=319653 RepID=UPI0029550B3F|nr:helix-turn-helix transcriptional regulator [Pediococcus ethanolidurans]MDV7719999.1 helix-turn-helix domain-containing protein [Pediococcus ethanolidurans]